MQLLEYVGLGDGAGVTGEAGVGKGVVGAVVSPQEHCLSSGRSRGAQICELHGSQLAIPSNAHVLAHTHYYIGLRGQT